MRIFLYLVLVSTIFVFSAKPVFSWSCWVGNPNHYYLYSNNDLIFLGQYRDGTYHVSEVFKGPIEVGDKIELACRGPWGCDNQSELVFAARNQNDEMQKTFLCGAEKYLRSNPYFIPYARNIKFAELTGVPFVTLWLLDKRNYYVSLGIVFGVIPLLILVISFFRKYCRRKKVV